MRRDEDRWRKPSTQGKVVRSVVKSTLESTKHRAQSTDTIAKDTKVTPDQNVTSASASASNPTNRTQDRDRDIKRQGDEDETRDERLQENVDVTYGTRVKHERVG
jgi:ABC-type nitrate/sulfonate/bicarbonate transport system substrate-binding protein